MASRKRQLLDVLRAQHKEATAHAPAEAPRPVSAPAVSRNRSLPSWLPLALRWAFGLGLAVLILWLISLIWPGPSGPQDPGPLQAKPPAAPVNPPQAAPAAAKSAPAAEVPRYGILAITYQGTANEQQATNTAVEIRDLLQPQSVQVRKHTEGGKTWFEIFIGQAGEKAALEALLKQVRSLSLPAQPGKKPFSDAFIKRIPLITP